jgi:hypothetical protein
VAEEAALSEVITVTPFRKMRRATAVVDDRTRGIAFGGTRESWDVLTRRFEEKTRLNAFACREAFFPDSR